MFEIVDCGEEGGFWIEGPTGRMGVSFLVKDDAEDYVETLEKGVETERARLKKLVADANFAETSPFTKYRDEIAFMDGFAAGVLARGAEIRRELLERWRVVKGSENALRAFEVDDEGILLYGIRERDLLSIINRVVPEAS